MIMGGIVNTYPLSLKEILKQASVWTQVLACVAGQLKRWVIEEARGGDYPPRAHTMDYEAVYFIMIMRPLALKLPACIR